LKFQKEHLKKKTNKKQRKKKQMDWMMDMISAIRMNLKNTLMMFRMKHSKDNQNLNIDLGPINFDIPYIHKTKLKKKISKKEVKRI